LARRGHPLRAAAPGAPYSSLFFSAGKMADVAQDTGLSQQCGDVATRGILALHRELRGLKGALTLTPSRSCRSSLRGQAAAASMSAGRPRQSGAAPSVPHRHRAPSTSRRRPTIRPLHVNHDDRHHHCPRRGPHRTAVGVPASLAGLLRQWRRTARWPNV
jgi:hypothetical protein